MSGPESERDELRLLRADIARLFHEAQGLLDRLDRVEGRAAARPTDPRPPMPVKAQIVEEHASPAPSLPGKSRIAFDPSGVPMAAPFAAPAASDLTSPLSSVPSSPAPVNRATGASWEAVVGGRWLTWIGASILILAVGFAVHFAWTRLHTPEWIKALAFHLLGAGVLGAGFVAARRKLPVLAQGLAGLGIFTLYAAAFGLLHFYRVMVGHEAIVFLECLLITILAIIVAVRTNSVAIVLLGALGGYLTPVLTSTGSGNYVVLFIYLAAYSIVWALYAAGMVAAGFLLRYRLLRLIGLFCFVPILLKVFFVDLSHLELIIRVLALAVVGMALLGVSFLYQRYAPRLLER